MRKCCFSSMNHPLDLVKFSQYLKQTKYAYDSSAANTHQSVVCWWFCSIRSTSPWRKRTRRMTSRSEKSNRGHSCSSESTTSQSVLLESVTVDVQAPVDQCVCFIALTEESESWLRQLKTKLRCADVAEKLMNVNQLRNLNSKRLVESVKWIICLPSK